MACTSAITSTVLTAGASFLANGAIPALGGSPLSASSSLTGAMTGINTQGWASSLNSTLSSMQSSITSFTGPMTAAWTNLQNTVGGSVFSSALGSLGPNAASALSSVVSGSIQSAQQYGLSWAGQTLNGIPGGTLVSGLIADPGKLGSIVGQAQSYVTQANQFINAASNAGGFLEKTWTNMDNVMTGGLTGISTWAKGLGGDIANLGNVVSWDKLSNLGSPGQLLENISKSTGLGEIGNKLSTLALDNNTLKSLGGSLVNASILAANGSPINMNTLGIDINAVAAQGASLPAAFQKQVYNVLQGVTGDKLTQVQSILGSNISGLNSAADLLNPAKIMPQAYQTLQTVIRTASPGWRAIYEDSTGAVNPELDFLGDNLKGIIPDDIAIANGALSRSFQQVKNISNTTTDSLSTAVLSMETAKGLPDIQTQDTPLPPAVKEFWQDQYNDSSSGIILGTGTGNVLTLCDCIGFAAGYNAAQPINDMANVTLQLESEGAFDGFNMPGDYDDPNIGIYQVIQYFCAGDYGPFPVYDPPIPPGPPPDPMPTPVSYEVIIPAGVKGEGTYSALTEEDAFADAWINGIIPAAEAELYIAAAVNPTLTAEQNTYNDIWTDQLGREFVNQQRITDISGTPSFSDIPSTSTTAMQMATSLHSYGTETDVGGAAYYFENIADTSTLGGQATVAALREGRNIQRLNEAGLGNDLSLDIYGVQEQAELSSGQNTEQEALDSLIKS